MAKTFSLNMITPDKTIYEGKAISMVVPGVAGYLGILADHAPFISSLAKGIIKIKEDSGREVVFESKAKGYIEVFKNKVSLIFEFYE